MTACVPPARVALSGVTLTDLLGDCEFQWQVAQRPEHITRVKTRLARSSPGVGRAGESDPQSEQLFAVLDHTVVLGYVEYTCSHNRAHIEWIASWGREHGVSGIANMLLAEVIRVCMHRKLKAVEARLVHRKCDPVWLLAAEQNLFNRHGFTNRYWIWDKDVILYDIKLRLGDEGVDE